MMESMDKNKSKISNNESVLVDHEEGDNQCKMQHIPKQEGIYLIRQGKGRKENTKVDCGRPARVVPKRRVR